MDMEWIKEFEALSAIGKRDLLAFGYEGLVLLRYLRERGT